MTLEKECVVPRGIRVGEIDSETVDSSKEGVQVEAVHRS